MAAASVVVAGGILAGLPAEAHSTTYCGHSQTWSRPNSIQWLGSTFSSSREISAGHIHRYSHWYYYPATGALQRMHNDAEKGCRH